MRTANNNFTVEALVAKYRNYVKEHSPKLRPFHGDSGAVTMISNSPERNADEQLLVTLYENIAGNNADEQVLATLSDYSQKYMAAGLEQDEFTFLCEHFNEVVDYEFSNRDLWLCSSHSERLAVSSQVCNLVKDMAKPKQGQTIFVAGASYGDVAVLFPNCTVKGFTGNFTIRLHNEIWALGQIRLYAAGINSEIVAGSFKEKSNEYIYALPEEESVDMIIFAPQGPFDIWSFWAHKCTDLQQLYRLLKKGGKMLIFADRRKMVGRENEFSLRQQLVKDKSIHTIVSFIDEFSKIPVERILLYIEKVENKEVNLVNAKKQISKVVSSDLLDPEILLPSYYDAIRPKNGVPLSEIVALPEEKELCSFVNEQFVLPDTAKDMFLVLPYNLGDTYMDANLRHKQVAMVDDPSFKEEHWAWSCVANEPCVLICGNEKELRVGYTTTLPDNGYAYMGSCCLVPRNGIDVRYVAALLFEPLVREQILTICDGNLTYTLPLILDKIIVPAHSDKERLSYLVEANYEAMVSSQEKLKQEAEHYRKAVRMRKHAMTQSLSSVEAMFFALNAYKGRQKGTISDNEVISRIKKTTVQEAFAFISKRLKDVMLQLDHIADVEYSFGKPEWIDPEEFIEGYITKKEKGWLNFKSVITWDKGNNKAKYDIVNDKKGYSIVGGGEPMRVFLFPKDALERVFGNIIANAQAHGFTDDSRKDYQLKFSWHTDGLSLFIEIENNGTPIPADRNTVSLLEYGVSSALHQNGHNGIGCNEIDDIMKRYNGKVEIISTPQNDYTVKYVLTFSHTNTIQ